MRRQPEFLAQVFSAPFMIGFLLYIRNPDQFMKVTASDIGGTVCVSAFAAASYLLIVAGSAVLRTELRTLWFLQCQPRSLADTFRTKARIWAVISMAMGASLLIGISHLSTRARRRSCDSGSIHDRRSLVDSQKSRSAC